MKIILCLHFKSTLCFLNFRVTDNVLENKPKILGAGQVPCLPPPGDAH